jgi:hypothetical protein
MASRLYYKRILVISFALVIYTRSIYRKWTLPTFIKKHFKVLATIFHSMFYYTGEKIQNENIRNFTDLSLAHFVLQILRFAVELRDRKFYRAV